MRRSVVVVAGAVALLVGPGISDAAGPLNVSDFKLRQRGNELLFTADVCSRVGRVLELQIQLRPNGSRERQSGRPSRTRVEYRCTDNMGLSHELLPETEGLWEGRMIVAHGDTVRRTRWREVFIRRR